MEPEKKKMVKKTLTFTPKMITMIEEIIDARGLMSAGDVIRIAISDLYDSTFPVYTRGGSRSNLTPTDKVLRKAEERKAKESLVRSELVQICESLGGEVIEKEGREACAYATYSGKAKYEQEVPLNLLSKDLLIAQYQPSKERVIQLQNEGKVTYEI